MTAALRTLWAAGAFVKAHALAFAFALVALLGFFLGVRVKKAPVLTTGPDPAQAKAEKVFAAASAEIAADDVQAKAQATEEHAAEVTAVVTQEEAKEPALQNNEDATNAFLKGVGAQVRGDDDPS